MATVVSTRYTHSEAAFLQFVKDVSERVVMCVELDLARTVEEDIILIKLFQALFKPFDVMFQLFEGV